MTMAFHPSDAKSVHYLSSLLEKAVSPYKLIDVAIERHGSWEWVAYRQDNLNRFVILALTETEQGSPLPIARAYSVELWAGADDGQRYWRDLVSRFTLAPFFLVEEGHLVQLQQLLRASVTRADALTSADLRESYLASRPLRKPA
jgi:hypothetical protein